MDSYFSNFIINILLMAFAIISVLELIYDKSIKGPFYRKIQKRGWYLFTIAILTIVFNLYKDWQTDIKEEEYKDAKAKSDLLLQKSQEEIRLLQISTKDSIIKKVDSTYINSIRASNEALAKYNLVITDSLNAVVSKLKLESDKPQLILAPLEVGKQPAFLSVVEGKNQLNIQFISKGGTCYNIKLVCTILKDSGNYNFTVFDAQTIAFGNRVLTEDILRTAFVEISSNILELTESIVFITGSFSKDPDGKFVISFNDAFKFNFKENKFISNLDMNFKKIKQKLKIN